MTREEIIPSRTDVLSMADETLDRMAPDGHCSEAYWTATDSELERFASLVAAAEREACAKVCEELLGIVSTGDEHMDGVLDCLAAIRARGNT